MQLYDNERQRYYFFYQMSNRLDANHLECVKQFRIRYHITDNSTSTFALKILNNKVSNLPPQYSKVFECTDLLNLKDLVNLDST